MAGGGVIRGSVHDQWVSASGIKGQRDKNYTNSIQIVLMNGRKHLIHTLVSVFMLKYFCCRLEIRYFEPDCFIC